MTTGLHADLQGAADYYLSELRAGDFESAFHGLIDLDPAIVSLLIAAYNSEASEDFCAGLIRIVSEFRSPLAIPLFEAVVRDRRDERWKDALDGLVTLGSAEAVAALGRTVSEESAALTPDSAYIEWVREALDQARQAQDASASANTSA